MAGTVVVLPNAKTRPHHHGEPETVPYIVCGSVRMRWGEAATHDRIGVPL